MVQIPQWPVHMAAHSCGLRPAACLFFQSMSSGTVLGIWSVWKCFFSSTPKPMKRSPGSEQGAVPSLSPSSEQGAVPSLCLPVLAPSSLCKPDQGDSLPSCSWNRLYRCAKLKRPGLPAIHCSLPGGCLPLCLQGRCSRGAFWQGPTWLHHSSSGRMVVELAVLWPPSMKGCSTSLLGSEKSSLPSQFAMPWCQVLPCHPVLITHIPFSTCFWQTLGSSRTLGEWRR